MIVNVKKMKSEKKNSNLHKFLKLLETFGFVDLLFSCDYCGSVFSSNIFVNKHELICQKKKKK